MSIEIVLIPVAIAAVSAWQAKRSADSAAEQAQQHAVAVNARMKNEHLLQRALADTHAVVHQDQHGIHATWATAQARFVRDQDGIWSAHFADTTGLREATDLIYAVDAAYGLHVQHEVIERLKARAPESGMTLESEHVEDDHTVTLILNVNAGAYP